MRKPLAAWRGPALMVIAVQGRLQEPSPAREHPRQPRGAVSQELAFLGAALAWPRTEARNAELRQRAVGTIDWARVVALAERHRVFGLLANALSQAGVKPPDPQRTVLEQQTVRVALHELAVASELTRLTVLFDQSGISAAVLKGLSVSVQNFGRLGLRQNRDIDLLLVPQDLAIAIDLLDGLGYVQVEPSERLSPRDLADWMRSHKDLVYRHNQRNLIVELHWRLFDNDQFDQSLGLKDYVTLSLPSGQKFKALSDDAAFAYMSAHGAQHAWSRFKWLADFSALSQRLGAQRVEQLYLRLRSLGLAPGAAQGLLLAQTYLGVPAPALVQADAQRDPRIRLLQALAFRAFGGDELEELEDKPLGSTVKTLSHYLLKAGVRYWSRQAGLDLFEVPKSHSSRLVRRLGPVAKVPMWFYLRARRRRLRRSEGPGVR